MEGYQQTRDTIISIPGLDDSCEIVIGPDITEALIGQGTSGTLIGRKATREENCTEVLIGEEELVEEGDLETPLQSPIRGDEDTQERGHNLEIYKPLFNFFNEKKYGFLNPSVLKMFLNVTYIARIKSYLTLPANCRPLMDTSYRIRHTPVISAITCLNLQTI